MNNNSHSFIPPALQHFSFTCPGLHGAGSKTRVERWSFEHLFKILQSNNIIIPLFQRSYCWNNSSSSIVSSWWRDTTNNYNHSCGKIIFRQHDNAYWCLDGQQRITTTMLLLSSARDSLLSLSAKYPLFGSSNELLSSLLSQLNSILYVDVDSALSFVSSLSSFVSPIAEGQRLEFIRLIPSFSDRKHYFEIILSGLFEHNNNNTDNNRDDNNNWMSKSTLDSNQYNTKKYFDQQFQNIIKNNNNNDEPAAILNNIIHKITCSLNTQLMMIEIQSKDINMYQIYQWLQESSLLSMGSLLHNPSPGMTMHACDLSRNLFMSPFTNESLERQEYYHSHFWINFIELPCGANLSKMDQVLQKLVSLHLSLEQQSEIENKLTTIIKSPAFNKHDLTGLMLYSRVLSLWEIMENDLKQSIVEEVERKQRVALMMMEMMKDVCVELFSS